MGTEIPRVCPTAGLTVRDVAQRYRVGEDKVRGWIARGELRALNTAMTMCGRSRWVVTPEALAEFERQRQGGPAAKPEPRRRRRPQNFVDYYPD
jgi:transposase